MLTVFKDLNTGSTRNGLGLAWVRASLLAGGSRHPQQSINRSLYVQSVTRSYLSLTGGNLGFKLQGLSLK